MRESVRMLDVGFIYSRLISSDKAAVLCYAAWPWFEIDEIRSDNRHSGISCRLAACLTIFNCQELDIFFVQKRRV